MDNKKRAIMVPVMTLAVCAIAMVGLGFALTTSVTSDNNDVKKLMVDLSNANDFTDDVSSKDVNNLFKCDISTSKTTDTENSKVTITYTLETTKAYLKVMGNYATTADLNISSTDLQNVTIHLKRISGSAGSASGDLSITSGTAGTEVSVGVNCVYEVTIQAIAGIDFSTGSKSIEYNINDTITELSTLTSIDKFNVQFSAEAS